MKFKKILIFLLLIFIIPLSNVKALETNYNDMVYDIVNIEKPSKVTVYLFYQDGCPHCAKEKEFLNELEKKYDININKFEISKDQTNYNYMEEVEKKFMLSLSGVPFTIVGTKTFVGYSDYVKDDIENAVKTYLGLNESLENNIEDKKTLPIIGNVNLKKVSIPLVAVVLGLVDGFNPCAMWILLFLISMLINMQSKKRMWILGIAFLFTSAFVYFLAMLGLSSLFSIFNTNIIKILISLVALIGGILNIRSYIITKNSGCHVVDSKKRKKYFEKIKKFTTEKNFLLALIGIMLLAASVNIVELACSAGFPTIFIEILDINNLSRFKEIMYILLYILFFLLDDLIVFILAMITLKTTGISTKYNRLSHLIGGILMILIGILLIFKPEWLMFNFG